MLDKIGLGITTCNRPEFFKQCIESIDLEKVDYVVVVNDGDPIDYKPSSLKIIFIQNETNLGVSKSKNKIFIRLMSLGCDHIFTMEDDCIITNNDVFEKYIEASYVTGLKHFNFGPASPWNRKQEDPTIIGDLSKRHLARQDAEPNPVLVVKYNDEISISLYQHIVAMFCYFRTSILEEIGTMNEDFFNSWEHVEHTFRIIKSGNYSPFWSFADITGSENYLKEAKDEKAKTSLAKDEETYMKQVHDGLVVFYKEHQIVPSMIPPSSEAEIKATLKKIYANR